MNKISIIIPCYNVEQYIDQCLNSIINQTYLNIEIIVVNDGSTDRTLYKIQKAAELDSRIIIIDQDNQGISAARNIGLVNSTGDFIMFVDADDWLDLDALYKIFQHYDNEDVIICSYTREFKTESLVKNLHLDGNYSAQLLQRKLLGPLNEEKKHLETLDSLAPVWGKVYKKRMLPTRLEFLDLSKIGTWEDGFFNLMVLNGCSKVRIVNSPFYHYRKSNTTSHTASYKPNLQSQWIVKFSLLIDFLIEEKKDKIFFDALSNRICLTFLGLCLNEINSGASFLKVNSNIQKMLNVEFYKIHFSNFDLRFLPPHWKVFYAFAKIRFPIGVTLMAYVAHAIINRKNK